MNGCINDESSLLMSFKKNEKKETIHSWLLELCTMALYLDHLIDEPQLEIEQSITIKAKETYWWCEQMNLKI